MDSILVVENDRAWVKQLRQVLADLGDTSEVKEITLVDEAPAKLQNADFMDGVTIVLVDLELGGAAGGGPRDYQGRDLVLAKIREYASWLPVVLVSMYISGDTGILSEVTPYDFDAVISKSFFSDSTTNRRHWERLRLRAALHRVAALTGRGCHTVEKLLNSAIDFQYGVAVHQHLERFDTRKVDELLKLLGLGSTRVVLDEVVQGFSGLSVIKATCPNGIKPVRWLIKIGTDLRGLDREAQAHRRMF
jgi:CheY-like chemotaxis protein